MREIVHQMIKKNSGELKIYYIKELTDNFLFDFTLLLLTLFSTTSFLNSFLKIITYFREETRHFCELTRNVGRYTEYTRNVGIFIFFFLFPYSLKFQIKLIFYNI